ncbi:MAG: hypothetical protein M1820_008282 [Bogoriella megaspora]|nr:MAG: hypothetical protein M1820_008282 [Bogoriella megaspora]
MRLLSCKASDNFELTDFNDDKLPRYAILSHTWIHGQEVTYDELVAGTGKEKAGYGKLRFCCERAAQDGLEYFWVDTCCINKATSDELSTAINSMFRWYQRAAKCYVFLSDVAVPYGVSDPQIYPKAWEDAFRRSRWHTRGWTLQELLASGSVEFFSGDGRLLGSKVLLEQAIHETTRIPVEALRGQHLSEFDIEERMSWTANRETTVKEDKAYCLLGIFGVFLPLIYGEGEAHAAMRLREEVCKRQNGQESKSLRDPAPATQLPFRRNEGFVGRDDQLRTLEDKLRPSGTHRRITICGLGGCGKTALAVECAYRIMVKQPTHMVFWVPAISRGTFEHAYREIGLFLRIPGISDDNANVKKLVKEKLSDARSGHWLMIVDNADDSQLLLGRPSDNAAPDRLMDYLPHNDQGAILFTTRGRKAAQDLTQSSILELYNMNKTEAEQLMIQRVTNQNLLADENAVTELLDLLTYLPLAIVQAAAFINSNDVPVAEYVSLFRQADTEAELFRERFEDPSRY